MALYRTNAEEEKMPKFRATMGERMDEFDKKNPRLSSAICLFVSVHMTGVFFSLIESSPNSFWMPLYASASSFWSVYSVVWLVKVLSRVSA